MRHEIGSSERYDNAVSATLYQKPGEILLLAAQWSNLTGGVVGAAAFTFGKVIQDRNDDSNDAIRI